MNRICLTDQILQIQSCYQFNKNILTCFFEAIFDQISVSLREDNFINLEIFTNYLDLPMILTRIIFKNFHTNKNYHPAQDELLTRSNFVEIMLGLYFGSLDEIIENFFKMFHSEKENNLNMKDLLLVLKFLTNDAVILKKYEQVINTFNKKTNLISNFENFKNYIFYEDTNLILIFFKLIYERQPFTKNVIKNIEFLCNNLEEQDEYESVNSSYSEEYSIIQGQFTNLVSNYEKSNYCKIYKLCNGKFEKFNVVIIDNNIFFFNSKNEKSKGSTFCSIVPISSYSFSKFEFVIDQRKLYCLNMQPKYSNASEVEKLYFKTIEELNRFLNLTKILKTAFDFFQEYSLIKEINKGDCSKVSLVSHKFTHEKFAVKIVNKNSIKDDRMIINEVESLKFLKLNPCENVVKIYQILEDTDNIYVVMEYLQTNLTNFIKTLSTDEEKISIMKQISNGLLFLHSNGIIHRDIKSDNIMINVENNRNYVKIVDFGFSKILFENELTTEPYGTLVYTAPEIIQRLSYNNTVDIWSLGNLMFQIHYKYLPFDGVNLNLSEIADRICEAEVKQLKNSKSKIDNIIQRCLTKDSFSRLSIKKVVDLLTLL